MKSTVERRSTVAGQINRLRESRIREIKAKNVANELRDVSLSGAFDSVPLVKTNSIEEQFTAIPRNSNQSLPGGESEIISHADRFGSMFSRQMSVAQAPV